MCPSEHWGMIILKDANLLGYLLSPLWVSTKFLKSWFYYQMIDKFGKVPYRTDYSDLTKDALVYSRQEAFPIGVALAEEALAALPETAGAAGITLSTDANAVDMIPYVVQSASNILLGRVQKAFA